MFNSTDVNLIGESDTNYTCKFTGSYKSILNISESYQSFTIEGGTLKLGTNQSSFKEYYFSIISDGYIKISHIEILFVNKMRNIIYIYGGCIYLEYLKVDKEDEKMWVYPLVEVYHNTFPVKIEIISCNITNCLYKFAESSNGRSAIIFSYSNSVCIEPIYINITLSYFYNNTFNLSSDNSGGIIYFHSKNNYSSIFLFL